MSAWPLRLVHASDLHLEQVPHGLAEMPEPLRPLLIDAAYRAAERVFDTALSEDAQALLLCGDVLDPQRAGPRAIVFLQQQLERMAQRNIAVYWAGGRVDPPQAWPASVELPENVHMFSDQQVDQLVLHHDGQPVALVSGMAGGGRSGISPARFAADPTGLLTVALTYGRVDAESLKHQKVHYLALGGSHHRKTPGSGELTSHYPGTPQGRSFEETGPRGCTVVEVDSSLRVRTRFVATDVLRWIAETISISETTDRGQLEDLFRARTEAAIDSAADRDLLIAWSVTGSGPLMAQLRTGALRDELLTRLRSEYGGRQPVAWSASLDIETTAELPRQWYQQETILGDFLRLVEQYQQNSNLPIELDRLLADRHAAGEVGAKLSLDDPEARARVLREAALLGASLLGAEEEPVA